MFKIKDIVSFLYPKTSLDMGGGGGGGSPNQTVTQQNAVSKYAQPYVEGMLGKTEALVNQEYQPYDKDRIAEFTDLQNKSFTDVGNLGIEGATTDAATMSKDYAGKAAATKYDPNTYANQYTSQTPYANTAFTQKDASAPELQNYQMTGPKDVSAQNFGGQSAQDYMSPYMQNVVDIQQREAQRQADIQGTQRGANAARSGAFGGSRQAVMDAEAARNLSTQKGDIQAQGLQAAYQQAQSQFNADQARQMQAALANQGMGYNVGAQNLAANLGVQQLGSGQNMQAQLANQSTDLQRQQLAEQSKQYGYGQGMANAQNMAQYGLGANQLTEQSKQYGAGLGLQGLQAGMAGAANLANVGQNQYGQRTGNINMANQYGTQQQQQQQNKLTQQYQDFQAQKQDPYNKLAFQQSMLSGLPISASTQNVYSNPSVTSQLVGAGTAAAGAYGLAKAKGGKITEKKRPAGLAELAIHKMA